MKQFIFTIILALTVVSCTTTSQQDVSNGNNVITEAKLLTMEQHDGYTVATVANPWGEGVMQRYVLVPVDAQLPDSLPEGTIVRTPLSNALVYSAVHSSLFAELGSHEAVKGIVDAQYYTDSLVLKGLEAGTIADCGSSMAPTIEKVIELRPDGILLSPYQDSNFEQLERLNIPLIMCADYMEQTPLGRAEWVKFYGALVGKETEAEQLYNQVVADYNKVKTECAQGTHHPKVLTETIISGVWNVPGGKSYMAQIIKDAGGIYPWADDDHSGSLSLDFNQVLAVAKDADVWLVKSFGIHSYEDLKGQYDLNDKFDAFSNRKVYVCDTNTTHLYERFPFHPDMLLKDYRDIFQGNVTEFTFFAPCK